MRCIALALLAACAAPHPAPSPPIDPNDPPETVIATYRAKRGKEAELQRVLEQHWATIARLGLVLPEPHLLFRGDDEPGKTMFVNIIRWKSHATPDHVPAEVQTIWDQMGPLVESRGGHPPIEFPEVTELPLR